ncbi:hypothetical protein DL93DRAFT_2165650 [Clavulina sp. PMI_390]|nr:hypothetical protein DL93DRAFT_2165650 [Clavulina sp. PMI_390]
MSSFAYSITILTFSSVAAASTCYNGYRSYNCNRWSTGARIGVGVGIAVAVIALLILSMLYRRRRLRRNQAMLSGGGHPPTGQYQANPYYPTQGQGAGYNAPATNYPPTGNEYPTQPQPAVNRETSQSDVPPAYPAATHQKFNPPPGPPPSHSV